MNRKTQRKLRKLYPYFGVVVMGLLIVLGVALFVKPVQEEIRPSKVVPSIETTEDPVITSSEIVTTEEESTKVAVPAIDAVNVDRLISRYYEAKLNNDAEALNNIVEREEPYTVADLADETQFISDYDDFTTYVLPGINERYFIVYVKYNIYFNGIDTGAPALNHFICVKDDEDYYYIYDAPVSGEFEAYIAETERSETVTKLKEQVEEELDKACTADTDLYYLMQLLNGETE